MLGLSRMGLKRLLGLMRSMKELSKRIGEELWLKPRYAILRFMKNKSAFKTEEFPSMIFTLKPIKEINIEEEIQLHIRFDGKDLWNGLQDVIDVDVYIPVEEFLKVASMFSEKKDMNGQKSLFDSI
jgi:hypothetical protein